MTSEIWAMSGLATGAVVVLALVVSWAGYTGPRRYSEGITRAVGLVTAGAVVSTISVAVFVLTGSADVAVTLLGPIVGAGALTAALVMPPSARPRVSWGRRATFAILVAGVVAIPVAVAVFASDGLLQITFRTLDLAGALPALQTAAVAGILALWAGRREVLAREPRLSWRTSTSVTLLGWALWIAWLVGMELAIDEVTPRIIAGAVVAPLLSAASWLLVQRLRHDQTTREGAIAGLVTGLAAITAACGFVDLVGAAAIGIVAGALGSLVAHSLVIHTAPTARLLPISLSIGSGTGIVALGIFSTRIGLAYTGQPELLFSQAASLAVVAAYSGVMSLILWRVLLHPSIRRTSAS